MTKERIYQEIKETREKLERLEEQMTTIEAPACFVAPQPGDKVRWHRGWTCETIECILIKPQYDLGKSCPHDFFGVILETTADGVWKRGEILDFSMSEFVSGEAEVL